MNATAIKKHMERLRNISEIMLAAEAELETLDEEASNWKRVVLMDRLSATRTMMRDAVRLFLNQWDGKVEVAS